MKIFVRIVVALLCILIASAAVAATYTVLVKPPQVTDPTVDQEAPLKNRTYNILCAGVDKAETNADTIVLVSFHPATKETKLLSLPRDTMSNVSRSLKKLNGSYSEGHPGNIDQLKQEVEMVSGLHVDRYMITTFDGFEHLVDAIGGVHMDVPQDLYYVDPYQDLEINIKAGEQTLDGKKALQFVRYRHGYAGGDLDRIKIQQRFFKAAIKSFLNPANITKLPAVADVIRKDMKTDLTVSELIWFGKQARGVQLEKSVSMFSLPGYPEYVDDISYYIPSEEGILRMLNAEYPRKTPWTAEDLDLVPLAKEVPALYGWGSENAEGTPTVDAPDDLEAGYGETPADAAPAPSNYGGAYSPQPEYNTNSPARGYTTYQPRRSAPGATAPPETTVIPAQPAPAEDPQTFQ